MNVLTIDTKNTQNIMLKVVSDMNDFFDGTADIQINDDENYFTIICDEYEMEVELNVEEGNIELLVDKYGTFSSDEKHDNETFTTIPQAIEFIKSLA